LPCLTPDLPRRRHGGCRAGPCPVAGPLELAGTGRVQHGAAPVAPHRGTPRRPPAPAHSTGFLTTTVKGAKLTQKAG